jgi:hypothetical protein
VRTPRVVKADELAIDAYLDWRDTCLIARTAYRCWQSANACERQLAYQTYLYALDDEEASATAYARLAALHEVFARPELLAERRHPCCAISRPSDLHHTANERRKT